MTREQLQRLKAQTERLKELNDKRKRLGLTTPFSTFADVQRLLDEGDIFREARDLLEENSDERAEVCISMASSYILASELYLEHMTNDA